jgi:hypothetical protein
VDKLTELLEKLSIKLGTTVEKLYLVLVKQAETAAIKSIAYSFLNFIFSVVFIFFATILFNLTKKDSDLIAWGWMGTCGCVIIAIVFIYCLVETTYHAITRFRNPEYFAMEEIFECLKQEQKG